MHAQAACVLHSLPGIADGATPVSWLRLYAPGCLVSKLAQQMFLMNDDDDIICQHVINVV